MRVVPPRTNDDRRAPERLPRRQRHGGALPPRPSKCGPGFCIRTADGHRKVSNDTVARPAAACTLLPRWQRPDARGGRGSLPSVVRIESNAWPEGRSRRVFEVIVRPEMHMVNAAVLDGWTALSDEVVVARILEGHVALFEVLMRRHNERLYRAARAILRDDAEAEDVMQQAYVNAYAQIGRAHV